MTKYHPIAMLMHWLTALAVLGLLIMGWVMTSLPPGSALQFSLFQTHKSVGMTVLALTVLRLIWRFTHPVPALPDTMPAVEQRLAHLGHFGLYALLLGLPVVGWAVVSTSAFNIPTVLYGVLPLPHLEILAHSANKAALFKVVKQLHDLGGLVLAGLIAIHAGAALRHHLVLKDNVLTRMLPVLALLLLTGPAAHAAEWSVEPDKSQLGFQGSQSGMVFSGRFSKWNAQIQFDPKDPAAGHAVIDIDMASAVTGDVQKDQSLPQAEWFDTAHFPKARFEAQGFRAKGGNAFEALGTLTIRGHGKDVTLPFTLDVTGDQAHAKGRLEILRTDYGVGQGAWATPQYVAFQVAVQFDIVAARKN